MTSPAQAPEPLAHPTILTEPTGGVSTIPQSRGRRRRLAVGLVVVGLAFTITNTAFGNVLLAAKIAILDPTHKVILLGIGSSISAVALTVSLFLWGALSDQIRSRFGRRTPLIVIGGVGGAAFMIFGGLASNVAALIVAYAGWGVFLCALSAAVLAIFPDRIPRERRGLYSAIYGGAQTLGGAISAIVASRFISNPSPLFFALAIVFVVGALLFVVLAPDVSNRDAPRARLDMKGMLAALKFPKAAPDFYWAFFGRFLVFLGQGGVFAFGIYILTDYMKLSNDKAGNLVALGGLILLGTLVIFTVLSGIVSDKIGRRKAPVFLASLILVAAVLILLVFPNPTGYLLNAFLYGVGTGMFLSVDAALMTEVLPSQESSGKDIAILNTANTVPNVIAPVLATSIVTAGLGYPVVFIASGVIGLLGAFSIFMIRSVR